MTPSTARRLLLLAGCIGGGLGAGFAGYALTGEQAWFLAVPAAMAAGKSYPMLAAPLLQISRVFA